LALASAVSKAIHGQQFGPGNDFVCGTAQLAVGTSAVGELSGVMAVTLGRARSVVPVSATVRVWRPAVTRPLISETPFECCLAWDGTFPEQAHMNRV
jgi:hypothetical protein